MPMAIRETSGGLAEMNRKGVRGIITITMIIATIIHANKNKEDNADIFEFGFIIALVMGIIETLSIVFMFV